MADSESKHGLHTNPAPEGGRLFPYDAVVGVLPDADKVSEAVHALSEQGFDESDMTVLSGEAGVASIDMKGKRHGLLGRIFRAIDVLGSEHDESQIHVTELRAGKIVLVVQIKNHEEKERVVAAFRDHDGHKVSYYTRWTTEHIIP